MGLLLACFYWGYPLLQIPGGGLSDRVGGDKVITVCALVWSTLTFITPLVPYAFSSNEAALTAMIIIRFLQGMSQSPHYPSMSSIVAAKVPLVKKGNAIATLFAATGCGTLINGFVGSLLLEFYGWHSVFYLFGTLGFIWSLGLLQFSRYFRRKDAAKLENQSREDMEPLVPNGASDTKEERTAARPFSCRTLITKIPFWAMLLSHQCVDFVFFISLSWLPTYFTETFPNEKGWVFNVLPWVVATFTSILSGWLGGWLLQKKFSITVTRKMLSAITFIGLSIPCFIVADTGSYPVALTCMVIVVGSQAFSNGCISVNALDIAPDHAGLVHGMSNGLAAAQGFVGTYIVGLILHNTGKWSIVFQMGGGIALVGLVIFTLFGSGEPVI